MESPNSAARASGAAEEHAFKAEMRQLLHLLVHSLYTHQDIFLRELVSNASDALNKVRFRMLTDRNVRDADASLRIDITTDPDAKTLVIEDTGIGMTREDLMERLGTVASSGTLDFLKQVNQGNQPVDGQLIGQFGVGFYSAFMVADRVVVETCAADPEAEGLRWTSDGTGTYQIEPADRTARGTRITLHLRESAEEFSSEARVRHVITKYSNFIDFPIALSGTQVNTVEALWRKPKGALGDEELKAFYQFISNDPRDPLGHLHVRMEGSTSFRSLLFVPAQAPPGLFREDFQRQLHLYAAGVYIQDDSELLPDYLRFVRGVVDTEDLPLNVSREVTQHSPVLGRIRKILVSRILGLLSEWAEAGAEEPAEQSGDAETTADTRYDTFFAQFGPLFKLGINTDEANRDTILELLRYASTHTDPGALTSLRAYKERMQPNQKEIFYVLGDHRSTVEKNPNLEYFKKHDLEVLLLLDPVDVFTFPYLTSYDGIPLTSIEKAELPADGRDNTNVPSTEDLGPLLSRMKEILQGQVHDVRLSRRLVDSAMTLVAAEGSLDRQTERVMKMMNQDLPVMPKVLEVNPAHPLVLHLAEQVQAGTEPDRVEAAIHQLYGGALLLEGTLDDPAGFVDRMLSFMEAALVPTPSTTSPTPREDG